MDLPDVRTHTVYAHILFVRNLNSETEYLAAQSRGVATGGTSVNIPPKSVYLKKFMWLFFSCDPGQIRYDICSRVGHDICFEIAMTS